MLNQLVDIKKMLEDLMQEIKEYQRFEPCTLEEMDKSFDSRWEKADYINTWAFDMFRTGKLPHAVARLIKADCIDNDVNMDTWNSLTTVILNADILLKVRR